MIKEELSFYDSSSPFLIMIKFKIRDWFLKHGILITEYKPRPMIEFCSKYFTNKVKGCELGVWYGDNAMGIKATLDCDLYLIDSYVSYIDEHYPNEYQYMSKADRIAHKRIKGTWTTREKLPEVDFIYIDANHAYEEVIKDIDFALSKVKHGVIGGHDYAMDYPGVIKAVNEKFKNVQCEDRDWWVVI